MARAWSLDRGATSVTREHEGGALHQIEQLPALLVVCEGETERSCLLELRARWRIPCVRVEVVAEAGDPKRVVVEAKRRQRDGYRRSERPSTWVVFDRDRHERWAEALEQARRLGLRLGHSNPCFELWALLLHEDNTRAIERGEAQRRLAEKHPRYHHERNPYLDPDTVLAGFDASRRRAEHLRKRRKEAGDRDGNPVTSFDEVVEAIRLLARSR